MSDNITLPRKHIDYAAHALEHFNKDAPDPLVSEIIHHLRTALAAEQPAPTVKESLTHPGYVIGSHWLETAYSRICAGEAEADVLRDCGWERVDEALRRDAFRKGFYAGFAATGEGWNGEYPFQDKNRPIAGDPSVEAAIDAAMKEGT